MIENIIAGELNPFYLRLNPPPEWLINSIKKFGIIEPIIAVQYDNQFYVIDGNWRYLIAKSLALKEIPIKLLKSNYKLKQIWLQVFELKRTGTPLNELEKAFAIKKVSKISELLTEDKLNILMSLNVQANLNYWEFLIKIAELPDSIHQKLSKNVLTIKHLELINNLSIKEIEALDKFLFEKCKFSYSEIKKLIDELKIIREKEGKSFREIFEEFYRNYIKEDMKELQAKKFKERFFTFLFKKRYPIRDKIEKTIKEKIDSLSLPADVKLNLPQDLEGDNLNLNVNISSLRDLQRLKNYFLNVDLKAWEELIEIIKRPDKLIKYE